MYPYLNPLHENLTVEDDESWETVKQRMYLATQCGNYRCLTDFINKGRVSKVLSPVSLAEARRCRHIPVEWLAVILMRTGVAPHWIMTGQGPMRSARPVVGSD